MFSNNFLQCLVWLGHGNIMPKYNKLSLEDFPTRRDGLGIFYHLFKNVLK